MLKLTEAQWRSPNGQWIHKKGIEPTLPVEAPAYAELPRLPTGLQLNLRLWREGSNRADDAANVGLQRWSRQRRL